VTLRRSAADAATLPETLAPAAPFPLITAQSLEREPVAPGISRATYRLLTSAGPEVVSIVIADPAEPTVQISTVLAHDRLLSPDETVSSMAHRSGAVAGINGDYFDINASGQPTGVLVQNGTLVHAPNGRAALVVRADRSVAFATFANAGDAQLTGVVTAIGGGPLLLSDGMPIDDPASPNYAERAVRIPVAAAARFPDGTLALVVIDGRHLATSIGVNRAELQALLAALGATDAMLFDSGGSATLVARRRGDVDATVINDPSDGIERPVADGLFFSSTAPVGPPSALVVRPDAIVALPGAAVPLRARVIDDAGHALGDAAGPWTLGAPPSIATIGDDDVLHVGETPGAYRTHVARAGVATELPLDIVPRVARLVVGPPRVNPDAGAAQQLTVTAYDARDRVVATDGLVRWSAAEATIDARSGELHAGSGDAQVTVVVGGVRKTVTIPVGRHDVPFAVGVTPQHGAPFRFVTAPAGGPGALNIGSALHLAFDFRAGERAAYAIATPDLPLMNPRALACTFATETPGVAVRATLIDRYGDREVVTFARALAGGAPQRLRVGVPASLAPPIALHAIYAVGTLANPALTSAGTVIISDCVTSIPGATPPAPAPAPSATP
jgi:exopolysaccharide biosynthesis protein